MTKEQILAKQRADLAVAKFIEEILGKYSVNAVLCA